MPSQHESDEAMSIADKSLRAALTRIKHFAADGQVVVDQAHEIAWIVSQALQLHGRNASVISPLLLSAAAEVWATMNVGQAPQWDHVLIDDSHMESHPFFHKTLGFEALAPAPLPNPVSPVPPPAPKVMSVPPIDSLAVEAPTPKTDKGKQPAWGTCTLAIKGNGAFACSAPKFKVPMTLLTRSQGNTKEVKQGKGKEKAVEITQPEQYNPPCKRKGQVIKSCGKCYHMKVRCDQPTSVDDDSPAPTEQDAMEDTDDAVAAHEDIDMSHEADNEQHIDIAAVAPKEPEVEQPAAIASAEDITAQNLQEDTITIPPPSPALPIPPPPPVTKPTTHECLVALTAQVAAMEMANCIALARVDAMELDFDSRICSMRAELSAMQFDVSAMVTLVNGLLNMVEKLRQERSVPNPSFLPPTMGTSHGSSATAMGMRYLNGVFGPSVTPNTDSVDIGQPSVSCPFGRPAAHSPVDKNHLGHD
ncbi:hypothetical protein EV702DRAFT_1046375 [Suillus placidus]|uniref:Uncharacterized protein n=1 Tax=Suillus placidus TaxID=48579 RepID=A0A9P7D202_9AGAM|nr:hypothetical protein EV702DRAFT_1046375 [Suillus placidus]